MVNVIDNPFLFSNDNKRYHTLAYHNYVTNGKSYKAVINAGFTCPNIDGTCGSGGCSFCSGGSGYFTSDAKLSIKEQIELEKRRIFSKFGKVKICGYFQAHTNTYCNLEKLKEVVYEAISVQDVSSIAIATRPDCLQEEKISFLADVNREVPVTIELGLQTIHDETGKKFNRGYDFSVFENCFNKLKEYKIRTCVHIILGLPYEDIAMMIKTAEALGILKPEAVKIHLLHINKGTKLEEDYNNGLYKALEFDEYIDAVVRTLELLDPSTVIERITGDGDKNKLVAPLWSRDKIKVLGTIDKALNERNTYQGRLCLAENHN